MPLAQALAHWYLLLTSTRSLEQRRKEFFDNVWDHAADSFQLTFDDRRPLKNSELENLYAVAILLRESNDDLVASRELLKIISGDVGFLELLIQVTGLTRSKLLGDLKASRVTRDALVTIPSKHSTLLSRPAAWNLAGPYLIARLRKTIGVVPLDAVSSVSEALNQSTWPGYIRQERAKRSGHAAEYRLATLFASIGISFAPEEKLDQPLHPDVLINGVSFDLVIPSREAPLLCIKATIHSANIGQFGESKDDLEIRQAKEMLVKSFSKPMPILLAMIDGIGFTSNRAGLNGVLSASDEFCQYDTIWKAAIIAAFVTDYPLTVELSSAILEEHREFIGRYAKSKIKIVAKECNVESAIRIEAGRAMILKGALGVK